ncbi:hypothetical protein [Clostridium sp. D53t1_180928_C8]|uniref:hypothetical protein n=1 Tax=Clostridium sp. D53t1_180928_C8 TaxID=2787101 RepID=UPI0018A9BA46|nr:hypothetical protein [Clostridium sp. D53t1_180928_C8]
MGERNYYYKSYGKIIKSEIEISEFIPHDYVDEDKVDIVVKKGNMPKNIKKQRDEENITRFYDGNEIWFYIKDVGTYYIKDAKTILVEPEEGCIFNDLKAFLIWRSMAACLLQKNIVTIHGSAVIINGRAVIFTGRSGSGKSTLTAAFRKNTYKFLSDELCVLSIDEDGHPIVNPGYPQQRLAKNTLEGLGFNCDDFIISKESKEMYSVPANNDFIDKPIKLAAIIEIEPCDDINTVEIDELEGTSKLMRMLKNIYMYWCTKYTGFKKSYYEQCINLAQNVRFLKLKRPKDGFTVNEQMKLVLEELTS